MANKVLDVKEFFFFPGTRSKFEGHFIMSSDDAELLSIMNEMKQATLTIQNYQLLLKVKNLESYELSHCLIHKFEEQEKEYTKCYFYSADIEKMG